MIKVSYEKGSNKIKITGLSNPPTIEEILQLEQIIKQQLKEKQMSNQESREQFNK